MVFRRIGSQHLSTPPLPPPDPHSYPTHHHHPHTPHPPTPTRSQGGARTLQMPSEIGRSPGAAKDAQKGWGPGCASPFSA